MYIASQKRKENIAEYLLYMWQIEDIIRANGLDLDKITVNIIDRYGLDDTQKKEMSEWYESLIDMMRRENVQKSGHLQLNKNIIIQLDDLHHALLKTQSLQNTRRNFIRRYPLSSNCVQNRAMTSSMKSRHASPPFTELSC